MDHRLRRGGEDGRRIIGSGGGGGGDCRCVVSFCRARRLPASVGRLSSEEDVAPLFARRGPQSRQRVSRSIPVAVAAAATVAADGSLRVGVEAVVL